MPPVEFRRLSEWKLIMKTQWYGDKRDLVKWATLLHPCDERKLKSIIQVPFLTDGESSHKLYVDDRPHKFPMLVWEHFRDLNHIKPVGKKAGVEIRIIPEGRFHHGQRDAYIEEVCRAIDASAGYPKAVFLDPDTGIEPAKADERHVKVAEIRKIWRCLRPGDWLVLYQHASRSKDWRSKQRRKFASACGVLAVRICGCKTIAHDVVFFCAERK